MKSYWPNGIFRKKQVPIESMEQIMIKLECQSDPAETLMYGLLCIGHIDPKGQIKNGSSFKSCISCRICNNELIAYYLPALGSTIHKKGSKHGHHYKHGEYILH